MGIILRGLEAHRRLWGRAGGGGVAEHGWVVLKDPPPSPSPLKGSGVGEGVLGLPN